MENTYVLKLNDGKDIIEEIKRVAEEEKIEYGMLVSASGSVKEFELVSTEPRGGMSRTSFKQSYEINSISGKVMCSKGKCDINIRVNVSDTGFTSQAGQLIKGKASGMLEIGIRKVNMKNIIGA